MWTQEEIDALLAPLRHADSDDQRVEVKEAAGGLPASLPKTVSAFSNGNGGTIVLGISERHDFSPADGFDAKTIASAMAQMCRDKLMPPIRPTIEVATYCGSPVVIAAIDELDPLDKPCYVRNRGRYSGSFIRVWDGDRKLSQYEIDRLLENRGQPTYDKEVIDEATVDDLMPDVLHAMLRLCREQRPRIFSGLSDDAALRALGVTGPGADGCIRPTLAGLLVAGNYPQQFFPRLNITFTRYQGYSKVFAGGVKYIDNRTLDGPIPEIIEEALLAVRRNMRIGGVLDGPLRKDSYEYPEEAVREAVVNAVMHRDYSPLARGGQIQVNMYTDRLEVLSPGGLYGAVTADTIGSPGTTSTRNQTLAKLLELTPFRGGTIAENRGTGFELIASSLRENGNGEPQISSTLTAFRVTFRSSDTSTLPDSRRDPRYAGWQHHNGTDYSASRGLDHGGMPRPAHPIVVPFPRSEIVSEDITGQEMYDRFIKGTPWLEEAYARYMGLTPGQPHGGAIVPTVRDEGAAETTNVVRGSIPLTFSDSTSSDDDDRSPLEQALLNLIGEHGAMATPQLVEATGAPRSTVTYQLRKLLATGVIERTQPARSPKQSYRLKTA
ncbi:ATP-binding protein [Bifidobacterium leontopitheci]|uniref:Putative ATP-dependent DNA helicase recG C-terminal n=1 Tax=Bifidobacterium leontopitheci TaxID=2650774 RepID=A0A6I1GN24_9BIFI|nr:ATP-binding protein [Bifidobacterium leontopitheci]KAB7790956.1 putative ATP-dependent DNA helicase recG C-terminal [Bifidobacterium leontopitheci]